jgi:tetratricopeptide (TPR) repeat protein/WD40 repeat protein
MRLTQRLFGVVVLALAGPVAGAAAQSPELVVLKGHSEPVERMTFSRSGRFLLTWSSETGAIIWNVAEGSPSRYLEDAQIRTTFAGEDDSVWVANPRGIRREDAAWLRDADVRFDSQREEVCVSSASERGEWELQTLCDGPLRFTSRDQAAEWALPQKIPDHEGHWAGNLFVAKIGSELVTFDPALRRTQVSPIADALSRISGVVSRGAETFVLVEEFLGKPAHRLRACELLSHRHRAAYPLDPVDRVAIDPSDTYLLRVGSAGKKAAFSIRRTEDSQIVTTGQVDDELIDSVAMSPDGRTFAVALLSGVVLFVDAPTRTVRRPAIFHPVRVAGIGVTEHQERLLTAGADSLHLWDLDWGYPAAMAPFIPDSAVAVSPWGAVGFGGKGEVRTFNGDQERTFPMQHSGQPSWLTVSKDGGYAAWLEAGKGGTSDLWLSDGTLLCSNAELVMAVFSPDSSKLAAACGRGPLRVYDLPTRRWLPGSARIRDGVPVAFEPGGKWLATAEDSKVCLRDASTLALKSCFDAEGTVTGLAYYIVGESDVIAAATRSGHVDVTMLLEPDLPVLLASIPLSSSNARLLLFTGPEVLITAGDDGVVRFWSSAHGRLLAMLMGGGAGDLRSFDRLNTGVKDWVVVSPDGFFDAGGRGVDWIRWRADGVTYPGDLLFSEFYVPGLLGMILRDGAPQRKQGPELATFLKTPALRALVMQRFARPRLVRGERETTLCLADEPSALGVIVNGSPEAPPKFERDINGPKDCRYRHTWANAVHVEALNAYGAESDASRSSRWYRVKRPLKRGAKLHVVMMAGSNYNQKTTGLQPLPGVAHSVTEIRKFFTEERKRLTPGAPEIVVWDLVPFQSRQPALNRLNEILRQVDQDDILFLYIAGHGVSPWGQNQFFVVPEEGRSGSLDELQSSALSSLDLAESLRAAPARRVLIVVDTCQSAASFGTLSKIGEAEVQSEEYYDGVGAAHGVWSERGLGFYMLASASPLQNASMPPSGPSPLVERMLRVWAADAVGGHSVTARTLVESFDAEQLTWGGQRPVTAALGMDFDLPSSGRAGRLAAEIAVAERAGAARHRGDELYKSGELTGALDAYRDAVKEDPKDGAALNQTGNIFSALNRVEEAEGAYRRAIAADDSNAVPHYNLGRILNGLHKYPEAVEAHRRAIELSPQYELPQLGLATALYALGDFNGATPFYRRAVELDTEDATAHFGLANTLNRVGRDFANRGEHNKAEQAFREAEEEYRRTAQLSPEESGPYVNLVGVLDKLGKFAEVDAVIKELIDRNSATASTFINHANTLNNLGRYREAEAAARRAISLNSNSAVALSNLGSALNNQSRYDEAEGAFRNAISSDPKYGLAYGNLGATLCNMHQYAEAAKAYREAIELSPNSAFFYIDLANILRLELRKDEAEADALYAQVLKLNAVPAGPLTSPDREAILREPAGAILYARYGDALMSLGKYWGAANAFGRATAADPGNPDFHRKRAEALRHFGRRKEADEEQQTAEKLALQR